MNKKSIAITYLISILCGVFAENENHDQLKFDPESWYIVDVYLDADNKGETGMKSNWLYTNAGIDYLAQGSFVYTYSGVPGANDWNWTDLSSMKRVCSYDSTFVEGLISKNVLLNPVIQDKFGIAIPYYLHNTSSADIIYLPSNQSTNEQNNLFSFKPPHFIKLDTFATFLPGQAFYYPNMKDPDTTQYIDFESVSNTENKNSQWASWAVQILSPSVYEVSLSIQNTEATTMQFSLVDMATNIVAKTFPPIEISEVYSDFKDIKARYLDLQDISAGNYMLKLKDHSPYSNNLQVEEIALSQKPSANTSILQPDSYRIRINQGILSVNGNNFFDINIFSLQGKIITTATDITTLNFQLDCGVYLLQLITSEQVVVKQVMVH